MKHEVDGFTSEQVTLTRISTLERVIGALIATHPKPGLFAHVLREGKYMADRGMFFQKTPDSLRSYSNQYLEQFALLADDWEKRREEARAQIARQSQPANTDD